MALYLCERLTFDRLFRISEPKRVYRSFTVRGPPLEIDSYQDAVYYIFNFKANPSTTGLRHRGYVKFFKPKNKNPKNTPLQNLECLVDCTCPDFRYRWAWANKQRQSSLVGPQSLNQAWNRAPRKTNPSGAPGLCKHVLATRQYIYGLMASFPGDTPDTAYKLDRLTRYATKRWTDFEGQMQAAKAKEREIRQRRELRNRGELPLTPPEPSEPSRETEPYSVDAPKRTPDDKKPVATTAFKAKRPPPLPSMANVPLPPGQHSATATPTPPVAKTAAKPKRLIGNRMVKALQPGAYGWLRPEEAQLVLPPYDAILESVVKTNMSNIHEALKLVQEMEADELSIRSEAPPADMGMGSDVGGDTLEPSEPPVSDSAVGADTEGDTAISLLRDMKNSLEQIAAAVAPVEEVPPGAEGAEGIGGGAGDLEPGGDMPMPDEPPADMDSESAGPGGEDEDEDEDEPKPGKDEDEED